MFNFHAFNEWMVKIGKAFASLTVMILVSASEKSSLVSPALPSTSSLSWIRGLK